MVNEIPELINNFYIQYNNFVNELKKKKDDVLIGTLGPEGTSCDFTTEYFCKIMKDKENIDNIKISLMESFPSVFESLENRSIDYAFVPNAYERITDYYWHPGFKNVLSILHPPPPYGFVSRRSFDIKSCKEKIRIASCSAVKNVIMYLDKKYFDDYIDIEVSSTAEAARAVVYEKADIGITNMTSFKKYEEYGLKFISDMFYAKVVFTIFQKKIDTEQKRIYIS